MAGIAAASIGVPLLGAHGTGSDLAWANFLNRPFTIAWAAASHLAATNFVSSAPSWLWGFYGPLTHAWEFSAGATLALLPAVVRSRRLAVVLGICGSVMLAASVFTINSATVFPGPSTALPVLAAVLLLLAGSGPRTLVQRMLSVRPLVKIGDWSYSLDLWHWPLIVFVPILWPGARLALVVAVLLAFLMAIASYRWVEQPICGLQLAGGLSVVGLVSLTLLVPLAATVELGRGADRGWGINVVLEAAATQRAAHDWADCMGEGSEFRSCHWDTDAPGATVYLLGDSNAA